MAIRCHRGMVAFEFNLSMKTTIKMNSRRFGAYEAKSYFINITRYWDNEFIEICFVNDDNFVESCELTIEREVLVNIATAIQSDACTSYQLNVRDGKIAVQSDLSIKQRIALFEMRLELHLLNEKLPLDITDKRTGEILYSANTKLSKNDIREIALHFDTWTMAQSPLKIWFDRAIKETMGIDPSTSQ